MLRPIVLSLKRKAKFIFGTLVSVVSSTLSLFYNSKEMDSSPSMEPEVDPTKPAVPISYPLKTLEEIENRSYFESFHYVFNKCSVPLPPSRASKPLEERPRLLVCHDMRGGYVDDKWVQGDDNSEAYGIWHWHLIDIFVYFSHNLVTLPPPCWTNTAHRHGVKVLGTFIAEWKEGKVICKTLLASQESARMYADRLTELAVQLGFDGWLLNMEVDLDLEQVSNLKEFTNHLTVSMHHSLPGSLVIWYDSVTKDGNLVWQNELNEKNKPFFDISDGIFVNYQWKEDTPRRSALVAGKRQYDVYMGIDVFGRGTYGGGQWKTNVAIEVAKKAAVSVVLFAPGWVYEEDPKPNFEDANNRRNSETLAVHVRQMFLLLRFLHRIHAHYTLSNGWWNLVGQSWPSSQTYPELFPFFSNFDQGHGKGVYIEGQKILDKPWSNISCQSFQPLLELASDSQDGQLQVFTNFQDPIYNGGACITIKGDIEESTHFMVKLFHGSIALGSSPCHISYSIKQENSSTLGIVINFSNMLNNEIIVFLAPEGTSSSNISTDAQRKFIVKHPNKNQKITPAKFHMFETQDSANLLEVDNTWVLKEYDLQMEDYILSTIYCVSYKGRLDSVKVLDILKENKFLSSSSAIFEASDPSQKQNVTGSSGAVMNTANSLYSASLGHISLTSSEDDNKIPPPDMWTFNGTFISWDTTSKGERLLSINLAWKLKSESYSSNVQANYVFPRYDLYVEKASQVQAHKLRGQDSIVDMASEYLGVAVVQAFYVSNLVVPPDCKVLRFILQICAPGGKISPLKDSPSFSINVSSVL